MKFTDEEKKLFFKWGHPESDLNQLEEATRFTVYKINYEIPISRTKAIELLGLETYLSGISRCAFHRTTSKTIMGTNDVISFDASKLFK